MTLVTINQKFAAIAPQADAAGPPSDRRLKVAEMFGLGLDETAEVVLYRDLALDVRPGDVVYVTGPSGSGKSVLLRRLAEALQAAHPGLPCVDLAAVTLPDGQAVVDLVPGFAGLRQGESGETDDLDGVLRLLSAAGLADAFALLRTPRQLSDGQRYRLRLALALAEAASRDRELAGTPDESPSRDREVAGIERREPRLPPLDNRELTLAARNPNCLLLADEFCSTLDRPCARAVAYRLRRMADRMGNLVLLVASAHDDLIDDLAPDVLVVKHAGAGAEVTYADPSRDRKVADTQRHKPRLTPLDNRDLTAAARKANTAPCTLLASVRIERGTPADWQALAPLHYRSHAAGAMTDIFRMVYEPSREPNVAENQRARQGGRLTVPSLIGVIVYSRSPLSLAARDRATGGRYRTAGMGRVAAAHLINRELRTISRVVLAPNWRGLGLASRLVAETLPLVGTPYVESMAAMGAMHPFFERAGMTAYAVPPSPHGARLLAALEAAGLARHDRRSAVALAAALDRLPPGPRDLAEREIARWVRSYLGAKNHRVNCPDRGRVLTLVAGHLDSRPVYFLWRRN